MNAVRHGEALRRDAAFAVGDIRAAEAIYRSAKSRREFTSTCLQLTLVFSTYISFIHAIL